MGAERIRVRIKGPDYVQTVVPKLSLNFNGVAVRRSEWGSAGDPQWVSTQYSRLHESCRWRREGADLRHWQFWVIRGPLPDRDGKIGNCRPARPTRLGKPTLGSVGRKRRQDPRRSSGGSWLRGDVCARALWEGIQQAIPAHASTDSQWPHYLGVEGYRSSAGYVFRQRHSRRARRLYLGSVPDSHIVSHGCRVRGGVPWGLLESRPYCGKSSTTSFREGSSANSVAKDTHPERRASRRCSTGQLLGTRPNFCVAGSTARVSRNLCVTALRNKDSILSSALCSGTFPREIRGVFTKSPVHWGHVSPKSCRPILLRTSRKR